MKTPIQFLVKFILASAIVFMLFVPFSKAYFTFLSIEANATFGLLDHGARLEVDKQGVYILYPDIFPPYRFKRDIKIPILQSIAIHFNIIGLRVALFYTRTTSRIIRTGLALSHPHCSDNKLKTAFKRLEKQSIIIVNRPNSPHET